MNEYDVLVIGSGPAGNTSAIYTVRAGLKTALFTGYTLGGQLTTTTKIENYPGFAVPILGSELMDNILEQSKNLGVEIIYDSVAKVDFSKRPFICETESGEKYTAKHVVIATGVNAKYLGIESEQKFKGHGISTCAVCDGNFFKNKIVAVLGGGDSAGTQALHLSSLASKVYLIHRRDQFRMSKVLENRIKSDSKIEVLLNKSVEEFIGDEDPKPILRGIKLKDKTSGEFTTLDLSGAFISIGKVPNTDMFANTELEIDKNGFIVTKHDSTKTNIKGVYAVGDVTNKQFKQAIVAAGLGCMAGLEIIDEAI